MPYQQGWEHPKKLQPALSSPSTNSPLSLLLHGSFWPLPSNSTLCAGTQDCGTGDAEIEAYFIAVLTESCSELAHQLNDSNENVISRWFLQPTPPSPKKIKWFILFKTTNIKSCPSTQRQLASVNIITTSVSHFIRQSKGKKKKLIVCSLSFDCDTFCPTVLLSRYKLGSKVRFFSGVCKCKCSCFCDRATFGCFNFFHDVLWSLFPDAEKRLSFPSNAKL